jgi:hypothetical protein
MAFEQYARLTEARIESQPQFLWAETRAGAGDTLAGIRRGTLLMEKLTTLDGGKRIQPPGALIHHWIGLVFAKGATLDEAVALARDYNRHQQVYAPIVARSKLTGREGADTYKFFLRFVTRKVITVTVNTDHVGRFTRVGKDRVRSSNHSTRIAEVEDAGTPQEKEKPIGNDGGYLWRLNTYWRFLERDGGTYIECESVSLTRSIPAAFSWLVGPFVNSVPRESLEFTLEKMRAPLTRQ